MRDSDMRAALLGQELAVHLAESSTLVRHEVGICAGKRRVDVMVVNGEISGWEIKSDEDSLARLAGQVDAYSRVLDRAALVTTTKWVDRLQCDLLPSWWGLTVAHLEEDGVIALELVRVAEDNSCYLDPFALAQLLWRDEALEELRRQGRSRGLSSKSRHYVWERLAESPVDDLRRIVRGRLKSRPHWSGGGRP